MFDTLWYMTWAMFSTDERNAWWLMMVVVCCTLITFIYTNYKDRQRIREIREDITYIKERLDELDG